MKRRILPILVAAALVVLLGSGIVSASQKVFPDAAIRGTRGRFFCPRGTRGRFFCPTFLTNLARDFGGGRFRDFLPREEVKKIQFNMLLRKWALLLVIPVLELFCQRRILFLKGRSL